MPSANFSSVPVYDPMQAVLAEQRRHRLVIALGFAAVTAPIWGPGLFVLYLLLF